MAEPTFTAQQIQEAVWAVLDEHPVSLLLDKPQSTEVPHGHLHPEDAGHVGRWVAEHLHATNASAAEAAQPKPAGSHVGRAWSGHAIEDECPCPQEACGLVDQGRADPSCEHHPIARMKSIRQGHPAKDCPSGAR